MFQTTVSVPTKGNSMNVIEKLKMPKVFCFFREFKVKVWAGSGLW